MSEPLSIQWFPGHMAKTRRIMRESMKLVDIVIELADARIPAASRNPELPRLLGGKPRLLLLNKSDAADAEITQRWLAYYKKQSLAALATDCRSGRGLGGFVTAVHQVLAEPMARWKAKGITGRPIRMMIAGIPNVGKSSLINRLAGSRRAKVEDRPGVTRGKQWVTLTSGLELLDMPGVLWPKFEEKKVGELLAFTGAVKDDILDTEQLATRLLEQLSQRYLPLVCQRYGLEQPAQEPYELLEQIARKRGMLQAGGVLNTERAAIMLLDEFRSGAIGRITLEEPRK